MTEKMTPMWIDPNSRTWPDLVARYGELTLAQAAHQALTLAERLELLAIARIMWRNVADSQARRIREARVAGATWEQVAQATGGDVATVRAIYEQWIIRQELHFDRGNGSIGLSPDERRAARELLDRP